jgi:uncharacterized protein YkwD
VKYMWVLAILSALLLAGFLLLRPRLGSLGTPRAPDTTGRARRQVPDGTASGPTATPAATGPGAARTSAPTDEEAARAGITHSDEIERLILDLVNENRRRAGYSDLAPDDTLRGSARLHSDDMLLRNFFEHVNPDGSAPADRIARLHRRLVGLTGENIWKGSGLDAARQEELAAEIVRDWMGSPGHRENILRPEYTHVGVGVSVKGGEVRVTQNFSFVRAMLDRPLPAAVHSGETLDLATNPAAEKYDFWLSEKGERAGDSLNLNDAAVRVSPGSYKLRFYFRKPDGYAIFTGPQIEVK